jgi:hypothetical protein
LEDAYCRTTHLDFVLPGLIKITKSVLAPNHSGIALLYRIAGLYRMALLEKAKKII